MACPWGVTVSGGVAVSDVPAFDTVTSIREECDGSMPPTEARAGSLDVVIERASADRLRAIGGAWRDLTIRALEPNVFMDPGLLRAAMLAAPEAKFAVLLAWNAARPDILVGIWGFRVGRALLPVPVLRAPAAPHSYLATPVLDRLRCESVLDAMLDFIAAAPDLPGIVSLAPLRADGPTMPVIRRILARRNADMRILATRQRPLLRSVADGKASFEAALSSSSRKKLRQNRRRLAERGDLRLCIHRSPAAVAATFEDFLMLEASGWKGRAGDALACSHADADFARNMVATLAQHGEATIYALMLGGRPASMQVALKCGCAAYTWKTAYDESLHDFSPGMLLLEDYTNAFLADPAISYVDSCAFDDSGYMAVWREREILADVWFDSRRGRSVRFARAARLEEAALALRGRFKTLYRAGKRTWKTLKV